MNLVQKIVKIILIFVAFNIVSTIFSYAQNIYNYTPPKQLNDGWRTMSLNSQSYDTTKVYQLFNQLKTGDHEIHSIVLVKDNQIVIEEYFSENTIEKQHDIRSATKSVTSLLMGIAIDRGIIGSLDDPITKYLKYPLQKKIDREKGQITIQHLLTMSTGLDCNDWDKKSKGQEDKIYRKKNWLQYFMNLPLINEPGSVSNYCTMGQVLAMEIISQAAGMSIEAFAEQYLFKPMNITNISWGHTSKRNMAPSGKRLYMTSRDMAKIGQLVLNKGKWYESQLVSEEWVNKSISRHTQISGIDYGYLWWSIPFKINNRTTNSTVATGNGGQYIFIFPEFDLIIVFTGGAYNSQEDKLPFAIVKDVFLPTFE